MPLLPLAGEGWDEGLFPFLLVPSLPFPTEKKKEEQDPHPALSRERERVSLR
jgi:hypothetical protein